MSLLNYKYYDSPEGQDVFKKCFVTSKYALMVGLPAATTDILMYSHPQGVINTLARFAYINGPLVGMAAAFTVAANVSQNFRGKNDHLNYFLGGVAAGSIFGAWQRNLAVAVPVCLALGVAAMTKKAAVDSGYTFFPKINMAKETAWSAKHDWTMSDDVGEKGWTARKYLL